MSIMARLSAWSSMRTRVARNWLRRELEMAVKLSNNVAGQLGGPVSDINVTPLVDVMLVLLIVFMVAAPLMASGVKVDLPTSNAKPLSEEKPPIAVSLNAEGKLYVDKTEVSRATLVSTLTSAAE